jgi:hypothetical protein
MLNKLNFTVAAFLPLVASLIFTGCAAKTDQCFNFGENITILMDHKVVDSFLGEVKDRVDFNDDGINDRVVLLPISKRSKIASDVIISNPFEMYQTKEAELSDKPHLAIGIIHSATEKAPCKRFIFYNNVVFGEWNGDPNVIYQPGKLLIGVETYHYKNFLMWTYKVENVFVVFWDGSEYKAEIVYKPEAD